MVLATAALTGSAAAAPISVTGYNADIIAEAGNGSLGTVTTAGVIRDIFTIAEVGYTGVPGQTGTPLTIVSDTVTSLSGTVYGVDADASNALIGDGSLTLVTPGQYQDLQFLLYYDIGTLTATLNFDDLSSTVLTSDSSSDWQGSNAFNAFASKTSAPRRDNNTYFGQGLWLREFSFSLSAADQVKTLNSIDINFSTANNRASILAVSGTATIPSPSAAIAGLVGLGGICLRRRRK